MVFVIWLAAPDRSAGGGDCVGGGVVGVVASGGDSDWCVRRFCRFFRSMRVIVRVAGSMRSTSPSSEALAHRCPSPRTSPYTRVRVSATGARSARAWSGQALGAWRARPWRSKARPRRRPSARCRLGTSASQQATGLPVDREQFSGPSAVRRRVFAAVCGALVAWVGDHAVPVMDKMVFPSGQLHGWPDIAGGEIDEQQLPARSQVRVCIRSER